jgi:hypothetical protein
MVTTEHGTSTIDKYQVVPLPPIEHRGYYYFPSNYLFSFDVYAESAAVSPMPYESIREQIMLQINRFYTIQEHIQTRSYHEVIDASSTFTPQIFLRLTNTKNLTRTLPMISRMPLIV